MSWFLKDKHRIYTDIRGDVAQFTDLGLLEYDPAQRLSDEDLHWSGEILEAIAREDHEILHGATGRSTSRSLEYTVKHGWVQMMAFKQRRANGVIEGKVIGQPLELIHGGWPARLDFQQECLVMPSGVKLTRKDLTTLHHVLHGLPRKVIARYTDVSVKAVEKRITNLRDKLHHPGCQCYSLHGCLKFYDMMTFLLQEADWFNLSPYHKVTQG